MKNQKFSQTKNFFEENEQKIFNKTKRKSFRLRFYSLKGYLQYIECVQRVYSLLL